MGSQDDRANIDRIARALAASAGVAWERLDPYPGYLRGIWRAKAKQILFHMALDAEGAA